MHYTFFLAKHGYTCTHVCSIGRLAVDTHCAMWQHGKATVFLCSLKQNCRGWPKTKSVRLAVVHSQQAWMLHVDNVHNVHNERKLALAINICMHSILSSIKSKAFYHYTLILPYRDIQTLNRDIKYLSVGSFNAFPWLMDISGTQQNAFVTLKLVQTWGYFNNIWYYSEWIIFPSNCQCHPGILKPQK